MLRRSLPVLALALPLAATAVACGETTLYPYKPIEEKPPCVNTMLGYAAVAGDGGTGEATTGGNLSTELPVSVTNVDDLTASLQSPGPRVILLDGMLAPPHPIRVTLDKDMRNGNKTLIGVGANSGLTGAGLDLSYSDNIIVRNLKIAKAAIGEGDAITLLNSHHIWIDHCDLSSDPNDTTSGYDGLVDITHGSSYITVSWTRFHDHRNSSLVGHTADISQMAEDSAIKVTFHHNLFLNVNSGIRIRFGIAHVFNNYFQNVIAFGVASESFAWAQVSYNVFTSVDNPITTMYQDSNPGTMTEMNNKFPAGLPVDIMRPTGPLPLIPYSFIPDSTDGVPRWVYDCAGTDKITLP